MLSCIILINARVFLTRDRNDMVWIYMSWHRKLLMSGKDIEDILSLKYSTLPDMSRFSLIFCYFSIVF